jgi:hypothetical protein
MDLLTKLVEQAQRFPETTSVYRNVKHELINQLKTAVPIRIQNVADYLFLETTDEQFNFYQDCPNVAPPWPTFFMSYKTPTRIRTKDGWRPERGPARELGYLFSGGEREADGGWRLRFFVFADGFGQGFDCRVNKDGQLWPFEEPHHLVSPVVRWPEFDIVSYKKPSLLLLVVPFLAISFCHCGNVPVIREPVPRKLKAKRARLHEWSPDACHTIDIGPMCRQLNAVGAKEPGGLKRALHICRGHFKDYRDGRGLFGKVHGMWWWKFRLTATSHKHQYEIA